MTWRQPARPVFVHFDGNARTEGPAIGGVLTTSRPCAIASFRGLGTVISPSPGTGTLEKGCTDGTR